MLYSLHSDLIASASSRVEFAIRRFRVSLPVGPVLGLDVRTACAPVLY